MGTKITFRRPDGKQAAGYLAKAGRAKAPGVVVIQEWWGLQDQIKGICDRFALAGYEALAPDLYAGTVVPYHDTEAAGREMNSLNFLEATDQVVRGAAQLLQRTGVKVGLTGRAHARRATHVACHWTFPQYRRTTRGGRCDSTGGAIRVTTSVSSWTGTA